MVGAIGGKHSTNAQKGQLTHNKASREVRRRLYPLSGVNAEESTGMETAASSPRDGSIQIVYLPETAPMSPSWRVLRSGVSVCLGRDICRL